MRKDLREFDVLNIVGKTLGIGRFSGLDKNGLWVLNLTGVKGFGVHLGGIGRAGLNVKHGRKKRKMVIKLLDDKKNQELNLS